jgi:tetratricopeptide (TPR) repeat protein
MSQAQAEVFDEDDYDDEPPPPPPRWSIGRALASAGFLRVLAGVPAVAAACIAVGFAAYPRGSVDNNYRTLVLDALSAQQFPRAIVGAERLLQHAPHNPEYQFWLALAHDGLGNKEVSGGIMEALAPKDRAGYGPAHFWQADVLLRQEPLSPTAVREAELHLRRVDPAQMNSEAVMRRMALVMLKTNRLEDARSYLGPADMNANPDLRVTYAEALLQRGRKDEADLEIRKAVDDLRQRVNRLGKSSADGGFARRALAEALVLQGDFAGADRIYQEGLVIGPPERYARPMAQFYGKWLSAPNASVRPAKAAVEDAIALLSKHNDGSLISNGLLSFLYQQVGKNAEAADILADLANTHPDAAFDLIRLYTRTNQPEKAKAEAKSASSLLEALVEKSPDEAGLRERLAEALLLLGENERAVTTLEAGRKFGNSPGMRSLLARAYVAWWDSANAGGPAPAYPKLELLRRAIDADPWNPLVFSRLGAINGDDAKAARDMVTGLLSKGESPPAAIHWILGNEAWSRKESRLARSHMEQAYALAPGNPLVLNNFAWMLAFSEPADLPRAIRLGEEGVKIAPNALELRDTRGRIYAKAGDWAKAYADLQLCLPVKKNDPEFLEMIAQASERNGFADIAKQYREQAASMKKPSKNAP